GGGEAQRGAGACVATPGPAGDASRGVDEAAELVSVEHRLGALEDAKIALEAGARVDHLALQIVERAVGAAVVLHEHEVPELEVALRAPDRGATSFAQALALVEVHLRARAAWARLPHLPEVVGTHALDPIGRDTHA